jgi:hypothetical protein
MHTYPLAGSLEAKRRFLSRRPTLADYAAPAPPTMNPHLVRALNVAKQARQTVARLRASMPLTEQATEAEPAGPRRKVSLVEFTSFSD